MLLIAVLSRELGLQAMTKAIGHRSSDGGGVLLDDHVGFGHRRLSIIDPDTRRQPMTFGDGLSWIAFNSEIYKYWEFVKSIEPYVPFIARSDTYVVLYFNRTNSVYCLSKLCGMFGFTIYDKRRSTLFAAGGFSRRRSFYCCNYERVFAFGFDIKGLLALQPELARLNQEGLVEYVTLRIVTLPGSRSHDAGKLLPSLYLVYLNGQVTVTRYWNLTIERDGLVPWQIYQIRWGRNSRGRSSTLSGALTNAPYFPSVMTP